MDYEKILETYSLEEILEYNDVDQSDVLEELVNEWGLTLPPIPVDSHEKT